MSLTLLSSQDHRLFVEGDHSHLYRKLGAHLMRQEGSESGVFFAVWAPNAEHVAVIGEFNSWDWSKNELSKSERSGIWECFVPGIGEGATYKYHVVSRNQGDRVDKADPLAFYAETPPKTSSVVWSLDYEWGDTEWMATRRAKNSLDAPISVYELHLGSWQRALEENNRSLSYREVAPLLADYVQNMGFTHVEFLPVMEHPFYGSWGYQTTGYFAPTSRQGTPQDLMYLIDYLHQHGIGVILDWVPSHFPMDEHGLMLFDGTHLYEHGDKRRGYHPDWNTAIFDYGLGEVRSFLISSALFWLDVYHADGLRVDAVASMLYLDYSRKKGEWVPNVNGGRENLEAVAFLRRLNEEVYRNYPDVQTFAEESTAWPMVSHPTHLGGLGFGLKWDMGWMNDTLRYISHSPMNRHAHHNEVTFRMTYAFDENFLLPLSHDEVVHEKRSLLAKMPGDGEQKFANLRLLLSYMWAQPGKKLLFMGGEFGQRNEWAHDENLAWELTESPPHKGLQRLVTELNKLYRGQVALHQLDADESGFEWINADDAESSVLTFLRKGRDDGDVLLAAFNFTPTLHENYTVGVPVPGIWREVFNTDHEEFGGSNQLNESDLIAVSPPSHGQPYSMTLKLPPLAALFLIPS